MEFLLIFVNEANEYLSFSKVGRQRRLEIDRFCVNTFVVQKDKTKMKTWSTERSHPCPTSSGSLFTHWHAQVLSVAGRSIRKDRERGQVGIHYTIYNHIVYSTTMYEPHKFLTMSSYCFDTDQWFLSSLWSGSGPSRTGFAMATAFCLTSAAHWFSAASFESGLLFGVAASLWACECTSDDTRTATVAFQWP